MSFVRGSHNALKDAVLGSIPLVQAKRVFDQVRADRAVWSSIHSVDDYTAAVGGRWSQMWRGAVDSAAAPWRNRDAEAIAGQVGYVGATAAIAVADGIAVAAAKADPLIEFANVNRTSGTRFASEYTSPSGARCYDVNSARSALPEGHPLNATGHHRGGAELGGLRHAYDAEGPAAIQGGQMRTVYVRGPSGPIRPGPPTGHGAPAAPCGKACQPLLDHLGVHW